MPKYEIQEWRVARQQRVVSDRWAADQRDVTITEQVADLVEIGLNDADGKPWAWTNGAYKVTATDNPTGQSYRRAKTFKGEMAWADSNRLYGDIIAEIQYGR